MRLQGKHSSRDLRAALLGDRKAPESLVTSTRCLGALRTIEGTLTIAAARTACAQYAKYYRRGAPCHFRRVFFQAMVVGALTFGLEVALLTDVDIRILHGCLVSVDCKFLGRRAHRW